MNKNDAVSCQSCGEEKLREQMVRGELIYGPLMEYIQIKRPGWTREQPICQTCLNELRTQYIRELIDPVSSKGDSPGAQILRLLQEKEGVVSRNVNDMYEDQMSFGERMADKIAEFGGSWRFIGIFTSVLLFWIAINTFLVIWKVYDPYPYILLNLILSCLAAIQAPIIMMSQNRQSKKDRLLADHDFKVNLKAEVEVRQLNWKIDQLLTTHWERLMEIQRVQTQMIEELVDRPKPSSE